jgi:glycosyltransferase involved in cell wall biosynthesis
MDPVTIILPCKNSGIYLIHALESLIKHTQYPYRLLLIESESTDGTDKVCEMYAKKYPFIEVHHIPSEGLVKALNYGLSKSTGDVFITQDDVVFPELYERDWLVEMVRMSKISEVGIVTSANGHGVSGPEYLDKLPWVGTWSMFLPRKTIDKIRYYEEI